MQRRHPQRPEKVRVALDGRTAGFQTSPAPSARLRAYVIETIASSNSVKYVWPCTSNRVLVMKAALNRNCAAMAIARIGSRRQEDRFTDAGQTIPAFAG
jgi:hypothetical protein